MPHSFSSAFSTAFNVDRGQGHGGWGQLQSMVREAQDIVRHDESTAPTSCAIDYTALRPGPEGKLYCPWCGLVWPDDAGSWGQFPGSF